MIHVAVGVIQNAHGEILIAKRPPHKPYPDYWEFPGGKVEDNEAVFDALARELREEIGIRVISAKPWLQIEHQYPDRKVLLDVWVVEDFVGEPKGREGQIVRWVALADVDQFKFPEGNKLILEKLVIS